jgi:leucyl aminopeptidase
MPNFQKDSNKMKILASTTPLAEQKKEALIVFFQGSENLLPAGNAVLKKQIAGYLKSSAFKGQAGQVSIIPAKDRQLILTGLGEAKDFHNGLLEQAAGAAVRSGCGAGIKSYAMATSIKLKGVSEANYQLLAGRGACWGTYSFSTFKSDHKKKPSTTLTFAGAVKDRAAIKTAEAQGASLLSTADLANLPGNAAPPAKIASWAKKMAKENGLSCQVLGKAELTKKGCGAILSVAEGSAQDAKMIILKHAGTDKKAKPIVLVGKTVTFDSGGISLKPGKGMGWMRYDKCGGMAVLTAMQMIARMNLKCSTPMLKAAWCWPMPSASPPTSSPPPSSTLPHSPGP